MTSRRAWRSALTQKSVEGAAKSLPRALADEPAAPHDYTITEKELEELRQIGILIDGLSPGAFFFGTGMVDVEACDDATFGADAAGSPGGT